MMAFFLSCLRQLGVLPTPPAAPITVSRERKTGWHLFPIGCFKSLCKPGPEPGGGRVPRSWAGEVGGSWPFSSPAQRLFRWVSLRYKCLSKTTGISCLRLLHRSRLGALWQIYGNEFIYLIRDCSSGVPIRLRWGWGTVSPERNLIKVQHLEP